MPPESPAATAARPLSGVRVVELAHVAAGPFAGMLLADLGADVVKVEPPTGDQMRAWPPFARDGAGACFSHNFASVNRNKRSVVADLKDPAQLASVRELVASADVVVENYRPGVLDRLGLGYDEVSAGHRGLVYASISGYGLTSPYVNDGAYDVVVQGMAGLMSVTGEPDGGPVKSGVPVGDFTAGLYAAYTIAAVLPQVRHSGTSVRLDVPMLDCLIGVSALQTSEYWGSGREPARLGTAHPRNAPYQGFAAADGDLTIAAGNDRLWAAVADVVGLPHLVEDPRFLTQADRVAHQGELAALLGEQLATEKRDHWLSELRRRGVPCGPVNTFGEVLADPHVEATGLVARLEVPVAGEVPTVVYPVRISGQDARLDRGAPALGGNPEVHAEWVAS
ncbi:CoA transferase [Nocardioides dongxiaopingii]|uniref:CaiB/BaiF CoA transferase family protein n=1 Tax=Nocardioides TaxID=1839 RepID=UPI0010C768BA|nr:MULTISPECIES: CoA transferase [Nocardioides]QCW49372.1 CoA transferase [Nocardioides sp. S-1144]